MLEQVAQIRMLLANLNQGMQIMIHEKEQFEKEFKRLNELVEKLTNENESLKKQLEDQKK